uniref:Phosphatidylinositol-glycan biosynthesis class W protein n=3 Tax=Rhodnius TaxID=13248 RepID=A0A4P6D858_RHOPR
MKATYSYRQLHESFMQNHNGTSVWENITVITPGPVLVYFIGLIQFYLFQGKSRNKWEHAVSFIIQFICFIYFLILNFTVLSYYIYIHVILLLIAYFSILFCYLKNTSKEFFILPRKRIEPRPYFTYFRSIVSIMTSICILAVDFHIFPRRYAKTETFGYGLMDTGVGFYIIANGIVIKQNHPQNDLIKSIRSSLPLIFLGIIRCASLETLDYQRHITEYGVHWNFFFTLAFVKLISSLLIYNYPRSVTGMAILTALSHQMLLYFVTEQWIITDSPRSNIVSANKEGLTSLPGYISLYLFGVAIGKFLNKRHVRLIDDVRHGLNAFFWALILLIFTLFLQLLFNVSRRLANLTYITWMLTMSLYGISLSIFSEIALRMSLRINREDLELFTPSILNAINYNILFYFLLSNLFTGLVNLILQTYFANKMLSLVILILYKFCVCGIVYVLYLNK